MMEWTKADSNVVMVAMWLRINKLKHAGVILHPYHVILFLKTKIYYLLLDFPKLKFSKCVDEQYKVFDV